MSPDLAFDGLRDQSSELSFGMHYGRTPSRVVQLVLLSSGKPRRFSQPGHYRLPR